MLAELDNCFLLIETDFLLLFYINELAICIAARHHQLILYSFNIVQLADIRVLSEEPVRE